jgi:small conductance mechanosensitive channel
MFTFIRDLSDPLRILVIVVIAVAVHLIVINIRRLSNRLMKSLPEASFSKARSITSLFTSILIFVLYFGTIGLILREFGVSLTAYLASASVVGLAIGFGSQGLVQDVVTGLTLIFSDLIDLGDMVEIGGQTGIVKKIGMRYIVLESYLGADIFIPNRTVTNVINYPKGYIRCLVDITLHNNPEIANQMVQKTKDIISAAVEQFSGIFIRGPSSEGKMKTSSGKVFWRIKFRIWPGRGTIIETTIKQEIVQSLKELDANYVDWMVSVNYEVEKKNLPVQ